MMAALTERGRFTAAFLRLMVLGVACVLGAVAQAADAETDRTADRPNILFAFADDWGAHAGAYGTEGLQTPTFDRVAEEGVLFEHAFTTVPSCTPSRGAVLTGQHPWRLGQGANLHSTLPAELPVYPWLLKEKAGYFVGHTRKGWGPGDYQAGGREKRPAGPKFESFEKFIENRPDDQPFCFWFGTSDPHRDYDASLRREMGIDPADVEVPPFLPDVPTTRRDIADYYAEVARFDKEVGQILQRLREMGELDNTIVVISGDHGMPFPRSKSHLYDAGSRVPLAIRWPERMSGGRVVTDFVNLVDLAPTFLEAAGVNPPGQMTGRSLMNLLASEKDGRTAAHRSHVILAKERHHGLCRADGNSYPSRAIRTANFLYIRNHEPDRWPAGSPYHSSSQNTFSDTDDGPTKRWMIQHANDSEVRPMFLQAFAKRPAEELYDLREDPHQMNNVADKEPYAAIKAHLAATLQSETRALDDPRAFGEGSRFDEYPYRVGYGVEEVEPSEAVKKALHLE